MTTPILPVPPDSDNLKRCSKCGELKPRDQFNAHKRHKDGLASQCKACTRELNRLYRAEHGDTVKENRRRYYINHRDALLEISRKYREAHPDTIKEYQRQYYKSNTERLRAYRADWRTENRDDRRVYSREYRAAHREELRVHYSNRKAIRRSAEGSFTAADIEAIRVAQGNRCYLCGKSLKRGCHIDHFIPIALGGTNDPGNLRLACPKCNMSKGAKHPHDLGRLI